MTAAELIAELEKLDPGTRIFKAGHPDGGGADEVDELDVTVIWLKHNGYYCSYAGDYGCVAEGTEGAIRGAWLS